MQKQSRLHPARWLLPAIACALSPGVARAYMIVSPDLDTLVNVSTTIVEGEVADSHDNTLTLRVGYTYRGTVKEGQTVEFTPGGYRKSSDFQPGAGFDKSDRLIVFLGPDENRATPRADRFTFYGMRMVLGGKAVDFKQEDNPGPAVPETLVGLTKPLGYEDFRNALEKRIQADDTVLTAIHKAAADKDGQQLVTFMARRPSKKDHLMMPGEDRLYRVAAEELATLHDFPALLDALLLKDGPSEVLEKCFYTPEGREFLLQTLGDRKVDAARRLACTRVLPYHGLIEKPPGQFNRDPHFVSRLAQLAADNADLPELCVALAGRVGGYGGMTRPPATKDPDVSASMDILAKLYRTITDESIRYCIDNALCSNSEAAYATLQAPGGPVIALVKPEPPNQPNQPAGRHFRVRLDWETHFAGQEKHTLQTEIFLEAPGAAAIDLGAGEPGTGVRGMSYQNILIPATVPAGKYRLFVRFLENGKTLGDSHAMSCELGPN